MAVEHSTLTGANLHEPKGVAAAAINKVYISDGAASGSWSKVTTSALDTTVTDLITATASGWRIIGTAQTASGASTVDFTTASYAAGFNGTYRSLMIAIQNAKVSSDGSNLYMRIGTGAGPTFVTSGYKYAVGVGHSGDSNFGVVASTSAAQMLLDHSGVPIGNASGENYNAFIYFNNPDATDFFSATVDGWYTGTSSQPVVAKGTIMYGTTGAVTGVRFLPSTGTVSGTFTMYGLYKG